MEAMRLAPKSEAANVGARHFDILIHSTKNILRASPLGAVDADVGDNRLSKTHPINNLRT